VWAGWGLTLAVVVGMAPSELASRTLESYLRVEWSVEPARDGKQRLRGYVYNERDTWAANVQLLVEALDGAGQVQGSTLASVYGDVPPRNRSCFEVPLPTAAASYRVTVRSVDRRGYGTGGG
jgi:hypothetical protein